MRRRSATRGCASTSATSATTTASTGRPGASTTSSTPPRSSRCRSCEFFPLEAVRTNVLGSANVIEAANANGVRSVVCLGTDKAAYPVNAMGMSKAMMEKVAQAFARNNPTAHTIVSTVRYGNVMMSRGLGDPAVHRADPGRPAADRDRPADDPVPDVARRRRAPRRARLRARAPGRPLHPQGARQHRSATWRTAVATALDVEPEVKVIGTRHGEKLYETLATREELARVPRTRATTSASPSTRATSTTSEYFDEGDVASRSSTTTTPTTPSVSTSHGVVDLLLVAAPRSGSCSWPPILDDGVRRRAVQRRSS